MVSFSAKLFYLNFHFMQQAVCLLSDTIDVQRPKTTREFIDAQLSYVFILSPEKIVFYMVFQMWFQPIIQKDNQKYHSEIPVLFIRYLLEWGEKALVFDFIEWRLILILLTLGLQLSVVSWGNVNNANTPSLKVVQTQLFNLLLEDCYIGLAWP